MIKVKWNEEEVILLVDLYYSLNKGSISSNLEEVNDLSRLLNLRARKLGIAQDEKFRNSTGVSMKLQNIRYIDTDGLEGLSGASQIDIAVVQKYSNNIEMLRQKADMIREQILS